jgi:broad specificity phosphatase PhoE
MGNGLDACAGASRSLVPCGDTAGARKKSFGSMSHLPTGLAGRGGGPREHRPRGEFVVRLDKYLVPDLVPGQGSCFVDLAISASAGQPVTRCYTVGRGFVAFPVAPRDDDVLVATLYDCDNAGGGGRSIGRAKIPVGALRQHLLGNPGRFALADEGDAEDAEDAEDGGVSGKKVVKETLTPRGHVFVSLMGPGQGPRFGGGDDQQRRAKVQDALFPQFEKEFFLIRHGQSVWNEGKSAKNPIKMMMQNDHPLTSHGILQAHRLNQRWRHMQASEDEEDTRSKDETGGAPADKKPAPKPDPELEELEEKFRRASRIIASPMTRALQTALLACHEHEALKKSSLLLDRNLRERKNGAFSIDCTGEAIGQGEIDARTRTTMLDHCGLSEGGEGEEGDDKNAASASKAGGGGGIFSLLEIESRLKPMVDVNNCDTRWWTRDSDNKVDIENRFVRLWSNLKYMDERSAVLVGHSNLFFDMISRYLDPAYCKGNHAWAEQLKSHKMDNAAVMYVKVQFPEGSIGASASSSPRIVDAQMLFGTRLSESLHAASDQRMVHFVQPGEEDLDVGQDGQEEQ